MGVFQCNALEELAIMLKPEPVWKRYEIIKCWSSTPPIVNFLVHNVPRQQRLLGDPIFLDPFLTISGLLDLGS